MECETSETSTSGQRSSWVAFCPAKDAATLVVITVLCYLTVPPVAKSSLALFYIDKGLVTGYPVNEASQPVKMTWLT